MSTQSFRNLCIIAHVDHGKTTLVDFLLRQSGSFQSHENIGDRVMDSMDLERERGITIAAKNTAIILGDTKVNIVDTPGHADFGGEVERILSMVDGALLLVDASEGPLPQTRFVLQKALERNFKPIVVVNKVDRPECRDGRRVKEVVNSIFDLFIDLGADDEQAHFPLLYACARDGWAVESWDEVEDVLSGNKTADLRKLFELFLEHIPAPKVDTESTEIKMLVSNLSYSDYVGELAIGRVFSGIVQKSMNMCRLGVNSKGDPVTENFQISRLYTFEGLKQIEVDQLACGDIGMIAGCENFEIGDTIASSKEIDPFPRISVEKPTVGILFAVNSSAFSGKEGNPLLSRTLEDRLLKETKRNVALKLERTDSPDQFRLLGRGELQFAILIEQMRREGSEFMVGKPTVVYQGQGESRKEPLEKAVVDLPQETANEITALFQSRKGVLISYDHLDALNRVRLTFEIPTRGLLGIRSRFLAITRGEGLLNTEFAGYVDFKGNIFQRTTGAIVSDRTGMATEYAIRNLEDRGTFFIQPGTQVYEGMVVGESNKNTDLNVYICREKKLTNMRASHGTALEHLHGIRQMSLEESLEWIENDEWIEVTPKSIRIRKKILACNQRSTKKENQDIQV